MVYSLAVKLSAGEHNSNVIYGSHDKDFHFKLVGAVQRPWDLFMLCLKPSLTFVQLGCFSWHQKLWGPSTAKSNPPSPRSSLGSIDGLHLAKKRWGNIHIYVMWKTHCSSNFRIRKHICSALTLITTSDAVEAPIMHCNIRRVHEPTAKYFVVTYGYIILCGMCISLLQGHLVCDSWNGGVCWTWL